ncbi:hypothetical protein B0A52_01308 [Exophiala mesophila]|uniref:Fumarylacetoacetase-like C-terminal domain-containing protein n=1 Tax=Exophiala mesophila TaxID=212818 RepID=A0A438NH24_EXOME|nr:hypothetical protein B0A52_01308 [Exophiala mesophila]
MSWKRLIHFEDEHGTQAFGEPDVKDVADFYLQLGNGSLSANVLRGDDMFALRDTNEKVRVQKLLPILTPKDVPLIKCIGLNYMKHIKEAGRSPPPYPTFFIKPSHSIAGFDEDIPIPQIAQDDQCDWEGELSIVIGKTGKNIKKEEALDYVAGYMASNDVSARKWQRDPAFAGSVPQWGFSKGFDKWAPVGPMIVSPSVVGDAGNLALTTTVDGVVRQSSNTNDLIFGVREIIAFVSQGTTLEKGTVIMTGTPSGVALGMANPPWLKHGQVVEVSIEQLGSVKNKMHFE